MSAKVVPHVPMSYDDGRMRLMVECLECGIEWGWTLETSSHADYLPVMAAEHNANAHDAAEQQAAAEAEYAHEMQVAKVEKALYEHREGALACYDHHVTPDHRIWCCVCGEHSITIPWREHMARAVVAALKGEQ